MANTPSSVFRVTDPELPFIAATAALEVDNVIHGRGAATPNLQKLSNLLRNSTSHLDHSTQPKHFMDPVSVDVFQRAIAESYNCHLNSIQDIAQKASEVAIQMASAPTKEDLLEILKRFCLELSRQAMTTRQMMQHSRSESPYKK
ncbi:hypothetical protein [uncultured Lamprocystis sp.]|jgi:hypothetical protein|uniref:hypothetical protein n=1 Tax=uncultured Lamprocystis sp. TaxID=543132 RepID=UPI0025D30E5F|nr:hypothetical protein [uncultured Lamprocystis sp.]